LTCLSVMRAPDRLSTQGEALEARPGQRGSPASNLLGRRCQGAGRDHAILGRLNCSHSQSVHTRHCAQANVGSGVAHMARPLLGQSALHHACRRSWSAFDRVGSDSVLVDAAWILAASGLHIRQAIVTMAFASTRPFTPSLCPVIHSRQAPAVFFIDALNSQIGRLGVMAVGETMTYLFAASAARCGGQPGGARLVRRNGSCVDTILAPRFLLFDVVASISRPLRSPAFPPSRVR